MGGLSFIAHPIDPELISVVNRIFPGKIGIFPLQPELNFGMVSVKSNFEVVTSTITILLILSIYLALRPLPETIDVWNNLLQTKPPCVAIGGADAHALPKKALWFRKVIFPYTYHFKTITNHLLLNEPYHRTFYRKIQVYEAFRKGSLFIGYDLPSLNQRFSFLRAGKKSNSTNR